MAKVITDEEFKEVTKRSSGPGRARIHDFDTWFDGQNWELETGVDFTAKVTSMITQIYAEGNRRGLKVQISRKPNGNIVVKSHGVKSDEPKVADKVATKKK